MREISHHVLDLVYNSIEAGARRVDISVSEDSPSDVLAVSVVDDGRGMSQEQVESALDPFFTTRKTRSVGLGLSLLDASARACEGKVEVHSCLGKGTTVTASFRRSHVDRQPLGDMAATLLVAIMSAPEVEFSYRHQVDGRLFSFDTPSVKRELGGGALTHPAVVRWLRAFLEDGLRDLEDGESVPDVGGRPSSGFQS